ncbi:unnamed protein product [Hymenolepis diminuta]|uniref:HTH_48 domain-containing protein n=1 Tax=Hymenolepis diminuta TaxID=6216 RepID=A0A0R3SB10_HYMDI|nr:unnamed protein product [Hymenolepis diminuta]
MFLHNREDYGNTSSSAATEAAAAAETLKDTYGNDVVNEKTRRRWFSTGDFEKDDLSLKDERGEPRAGCSKELNSEQLQVGIDGNATSSTRELSKILNVGRHVTIWPYMGK